MKDKNRPKENVIKGKENKYKIYKKSLIKFKYKL